MLGGRKVELHTADTAGNPAQTRTKTQELVERLKVSVLIGPLAAFEALAIDDYIRSSQTPILTVAGAEDMTQRKANPWLVRPSSTSAQPSHPVGDYAAKDLKLKRVACIADDFAFGHENVAGFQRVFEDGGGKVVQKLCTPLNAPDYGTYISQLKPNLDGVYTGHAGSNGFKFIKQLARIRQQDRRSSAASRRSTNRCCSRWAMTRSAPSPATGIRRSSTTRSTSASSPRSRRTTRSIPASMRRKPISAARCWKQAVKEVERQCRGQGRFMKALKGVNVKESIRGPVQLRRIRQRGRQQLHPQGRDARTASSSTRWSRPIRIVSQFWTYKPEEFLKQPVYSRDFPPAKNLEP